MPSIYNLCYGPYGLSPRPRHGPQPWAKEEKVGYGRFVELQIMVHIE